MDRHTFSQKDECPHWDLGHCFCDEEENDILGEVRTNHAVLVAGGPDKEFPERYDIRISGPYELMQRLIGIL